MKKEGNDRIKNILLNPDAWRVAWYCQKHYGEDRGQNDHKTVAFFAETPECTCGREISPREIAFVQPSSKFFELLRAARQFAFATNCPEIKRTPFFAVNRDEIDPATLQPLVRKNGRYYPARVVGTPSVV